MSTHDSIDSVVNPTSEQMIERLQSVLPKYPHLLKSVLASIQSDDRLTLPQLRSLSAIEASDGGMITSILARQLRSAAPTVTRIVDGLVERGLVERRPDPEDRRRLRLAILTPGADLLTEYEMTLHTVLAERLTNVPPARRSALLLALDDLDLLLSDPIESLDAPANG